MAGGIARKLTGRDIDTRLLTEAQRTRLAAEQQAGKIAALVDPRPLRIAARMDWRINWRRRFRRMARRLTGRDMDTRDMTEAQRTAVNWEAVRQMNAAHRESVRGRLAGRLEAVRVERARLRPLRKFTPD